MSIVDAQTLLVNVVAQVSNCGYNRTALGSIPSDCLIFSSAKRLLGSRLGDGIRGALVQFGCYQHR